MVGYNDEKNDFLCEYPEAFMASYLFTVSPIKFGCGLHFGQLNYGDLDGQDKLVLKRKPDGL